MKKSYLKPSTITIHLEPCKLLEGSKVYTDDPQSPGSAMSRSARFTRGGFENDEE